MKSRDGFAAAILVFVILALVVAGGIAYVHYVYLPRMAAQNSNSSTSSITNLASSSSEFLIPEWGVGFQVSEGLSSLVYHISNRSNGAAIATFSTKDLENIAPACSPDTTSGIGSLARWVYNASDTTAGVHIGGYTYSFIEVQGGICTEPGVLPGDNITVTTATRLFSQQSSQLEQAIDNALVSISNGATSPHNATSMPSGGGALTQTATNATPPPVISNNQTTLTPAAFSCSYEDGTNIGIVIHASFPSYIDPSIVEVPYSGGDNAIISKDLSQNLFCVKARKAYVDELFFAENKKNGAAILTVVVNPTKGQQYTVDANSTAVGLMFMNPYFFNSNPASAQVILAAIAKDPNISTFAQFIQTTPDFASQLNTNTQMTTLVQTMTVSIMKALTATSTTTTAAAIQITAPAGNDTWSASASTQQTITWKSQGVDSNAQAQIYLYFPDGSQCNIGTSPVGDGVFNVILPSMGCAGSTQKPNLVPGGYSIAIVVEGANNTVVAAGQSGWFNITQ